MLPNQSILARAGCRQSGLRLHYGFQWYMLERKSMPDSEKQRLAAEVEKRWVDFQDGLSDKRRYPMAQFMKFWTAGKRYAELTRNDGLIHRNVAVAINGLREFVSSERKRIPDTILRDA